MWSFGNADLSRLCAGTGGKISRAHNFTADDDVAAKAHAAGYVNGHDVELWCGEDKVALLHSENHVKRSR